MKITPFQLAQRYIGIREFKGTENHPLIAWWLSLCGFGLKVADEVAWCSAFVNAICWELRLPRTKSAAARSWLTIGEAVDVHNGIAGFDVVVLSRGTNQPGPDVLQAPGHVGFLAGVEQDPISGLVEFVHVLGGNQQDSVCVARFPIDRVLGVRRLAAAVAA